MARIKITDLDEKKKISKSELKKIKGGLAETRKSDEDSNRIELTYVNLGASQERERSGQASGRRSWGSPEGWVIRANS